MLYSPFLLYIQCNDTFWCLTIFLFNKEKRKEKKLPLELPFLFTLFVLDWFRFFLPSVLGSDYILYEPLLFISFFWPSELNKNYSINLLIIRFVCKSQVLPDSFWFSQYTCEIDSSSLEPRMQLSGSNLKDLDDLII